MPKRHLIGHWFQVRENPVSNFCHLYRHGLEARRGSSPRRLSIDPTKVGEVSGMPSPRRLSPLSEPASPRAVSRDNSPERSLPDGSDSIFNGLPRLMQLYAEQQAFTRVSPPPITMEMRKRKQQVTTKKRKSVFSPKDVSNQPMLSPLARSDDGSYRQWLNLDVDGMGGVNHSRLLPCPTSPRRHSMATGAKRQPLSGQASPGTALGLRPPTDHGWNDQTTENGYLGTPQSEETTASHRRVTLPYLPGGHGFSSLAMEN